MDLLPSVNKAYSMISSVEKQQEVHVVFEESTEGGAYLPVPKIVERKQTAKEISRKGIISRKEKDIATIGMLMVIFLIHVSNCMVVLNGISILKIKRVKIRLKI